MTSRLTGMGLITRVEHPLERLGDLVEAERQRQCSLALAGRRRTVRACVVGASLVASMFGAAVVSYALLGAEPEAASEGPRDAARGEPALQADLLGVSDIPQEAATRPNLWPRLEPDALSGAFWSIAATDQSSRPQPGISLQAEAILSFGQRLPPDYIALRPRDADVTLMLAEAVPQENVQTLGAALETVRPMSTRVLSGLPPGSFVLNGVEVGDGTIVMAADGAGDIDVKLPDGVREPVRADVEVLGPDGARTSRFALTIRPQSGGKARAPRGRRAAQKADASREGDASYGRRVGAARRSYADEEEAPPPRAPEGFSLFGSSGR